jgi:hypothetical protein
MENNIVDLYNLIYFNYVNKEIEYIDNYSTLLNDIILNLKNNIIAKYEEPYYFKKEYFSYNPIFNKNNSRYNDFDINRLPLIKFAGYLGIRVEKSGQLDCLGLYNPRDHYIMMGTDDSVVFFHELAHAVDHIILNLFNYPLTYENNSKIYKEITAEMVAITLANIFKISSNLESSKYYMERYTGKKNLFVIINEVKEKVLRICNYIVKYQCKWSKIFI